MTRSAPARARRRLEPTWLSAPVYVETFGPEVADLNAAAGLVPDPEQELILDLIFGIGPNGKSVCFEVDIIGPRQVMGKTGTLKMAELGWLYITDERLVVHSAHELDTTGEAFRDLKTMIQDHSFLSKHLDPNVGKEPGITEGNGRWAIHLTGDRRIKFKARTISGGRGLTGNKVVLDEGFALMPSHMGALLPTLGVVPDPQVVIASSAGKLESAVLREKRQSGRAGTDPRQGYVEYGDKDPSGCKERGCDHHKSRRGCVLDDERRWRRFMVALNSGRADIETVRALRDSMPAAEFAREFMVHWEDPPNGDQAGAIDVLKWGSLVNPKAKSPKNATVVLDVAPDRKKASIGVAGGGKKGRTLLMSLTRGGTRWVVPKLIDLMDKQSIEEVALHPGTQAAVLIPALNDAGIEFHKLTTGEVAQGCAWLLEQMESRKPKIEHVGQPELDKAIGNATTRSLSSGEAEIWERRDKAIDITAVYATSIAGYRWSLQDNYDVEDSFL